MNSSMENLNMAPDMEGDSGCSPCEFEQNQEIIMKLPFFGGMPDSMIKGLAYFSNKLHFKAGEALFEQNDFDDKAYYVISGEVEILRMKDGKEMYAGSFGKGDFFGGLALTSSVKRLFTAKAKTDLACLVIRRKGLLSNLEKSPEIALAMLKVGSREVVEWDEQRIKQFGDKEDCLRQLGVSLI